MDGTDGLKNAYIDLRDASQDKDCGFVYVLLDLCLYEFEDLVVGAYQLLSQFLGRNDSLFKHLLVVLPITDHETGRLSVQVHLDLELDLDLDLDG